ncbi:hypothetical protein J3459_014032 [Metarhizium acridum]|nr:hypothetical protein J3459_014032 [Metarhizium acridum]
MAPNRVIPRACRYALPHSQVPVPIVAARETGAPGLLHDPPQITPINDRLDRLEKAVGSLVTSNHPHALETDEPSPVVDEVRDLRAVINYQTATATPKETPLDMKQLRTPQLVASLVIRLLQILKTPRDAPVAVGSSLRLTSRLNDDLESWMIRLYSITRLERGRSIITLFLSDTKLPHCCGYKHSSTLVKGKVGLVAAAGSPYGIGRSLVMALASAGPKAVYATDLTLANIQPLGKEVQGSGSTCSIHGAVLDMTSEEQTVQMIKQALAEYGRFDFFFAYAGVGLCKTRPIMTGRLASCSGLSSWR